MNSARYLTPMILLGVAIGQIRQGQDGMAIIILCGIGAMLLTLYILDTIDERRQRSRLR